MRGDGEDGSMNYHSFGLPVMQWLSGGAHFFLPSTLGGEELAAHLWDAYHALPPQVALNMFNLIDSHGVPRALYRLGGDKVKLRAALTLLLGYPGVPCLPGSDALAGRDRGRQRRRPGSPRPGGLGHRPVCRRSAADRLQKGHARAATRLDAFFAGPGRGHRFCA